MLAFLLAGLIAISDFQLYFVFNSAISFWSFPHVNYRRP
jgi:hypothetical protein